MKSEMKRAPTIAVMCLPWFPKAPNIVRVGESPQKYSTKGVLGYKIIMRFILIRF
jgi:hypothetical protein